MAILVSGGAGYIGSHTCIELLNAGYDIVVADNFYNSCPVVLDRIKQITGKDFRFYEADMTKTDDVEHIFSECPDITAVIQFAAYKAVGESVHKPIEYYSNNLNCTLTILDVMRRHDCHNFVFSSSATVYGDPASVPITEDFPTGNTTNPYGTTKVFTERILTDCCHADPELNVALLRYFNPIGAHPSGLIGEDPKGIPKEVWDGVRSGLSLVASYARWQVAQAKEQAAKAEHNAAAAQQNQKNANRSTGSMKSAGEDNRNKDPFLDGWDS